MNSAARSASETVHAFELAGLGRAPYRFAGQETSEDVRAALAAMPHPKAASPFFASSTMLDWVEYMRAHAGAAGRARALKALTAAVRS